MLPFLKKSQEAGMQGPIESVTRQADYDDEDKDSFDSMEVAAEDMMAAIQSKDVKALAQALRAAYQLCESEPHTEGPDNG